MLTSYKILYCVVRRAWLILSLKSPRQTACEQARQECVMLVAQERQGTACSTAAARICEQSISFIPLSLFSLFPSLIFPGGIAGAASLSLIHGQAEEASLTCGLHGQALLRNQPDQQDAVPAAAQSLAWVACVLGMISPCKQTAREEPFASRTLPCKWQQTWPGLFTCLRLMLRKEKVSLAVHVHIPSVGKKNMSKARLANCLQMSQEASQSSVLALQVVSSFLNCVYQCKAKWSTQAWPYPVIS